MANQMFSRDEQRRQKQIDEARKAGKIPAALDEEGREINPHMPQYIVNAPWYLSKNHTGPTLGHQRIRGEHQKTQIETWYPRGEKGEAQKKFQLGACQNCGATTHITKECCDRPRKVGAQFSGQDMQPDDLLITLPGLSYDEKRDRWNGFDPSTYKDVILEHEMFDIKRKQLKEPEIDGKNMKGDDDFKDNGTGELQTQMMTRDPRTKTMTRNLRIREDQANYLLNLDVNSAYFDPKSRSLRDNPNPHLPNEKQVFKGLNHVRLTGETVTMYEQEKFAWDHAERNNLELNTVALPTLTEKTYKVIKQKKEYQKLGRTGGLLEKYGGEEHLQSELDLVLGQTERYVEYNEFGQPIPLNKKKDTTKSRYPEDIFNNDHLSVWGSWWNEILGWGYECCHSNEKQSQCLGEKGRRLALQKEYKLRKEIEEDLRKKEEILKQQENQDSLITA